jgi:hypothetical protein
VDCSFICFQFDFGLHMKSFQNCLMLKLQNRYVLYQKRITFFFILIKWSSSQQLLTTQHIFWSLRPSFCTILRHIMTSYSKKAPERCLLDIMKNNIYYVFQCLILSFSQMSCDLQITLCLN